MAKRSNIRQSDQAIIQVVLMTNEMKSMCDMLNLNYTQFADKQGLSDRCNRIRKDQKRLNEKGLLNQPVLKRLFKRERVPTVEEAIEYANDFVRALAIENQMTQARVTEHDTDFSDARAEEKYRKNYDEGQTSVETSDVRSTFAEEDEGDRE